ncbi:MAG: hypothetical protein ACFFCZ_25865 [Promethearchaeota archaeon]
MNFVSQKFNNEIVESSFYLIIYLALNLSIIFASLIFNSIFGYSMIYGSLASISLLSAFILQSVTSIIFCWFWIKSNLKKPALWQWALLYLVIWICALIAFGLAVIYFFNQDLLTLIIIGPFLGLILPANPLILFYVVTWTVKQIENKETLPTRQKKEIESFSELLKGKKDDLKAIGYLGLFLTLQTVAGYGITFSSSFFISVFNGEGLYIGTLTSLAGILSRLLIGCFFGWLWTYLAFRWDLDEKPTTLQWGLSFLIMVFLGVLIGVIGLFNLPEALRGPYILTFPLMFGIAVLVVPETFYLAFYLAITLPGSAFIGVAVILVLLGYLILFISPVLPVTFFSIGNYLAKRKYKKRNVELLVSPQTV